MRQGADLDGSVEMTQVTGHGRPGGHAYLAACMVAAMLIGVVAVGAFGRQRTPQATVAEATPTGATAAPTVVATQTLAPEVAYWTEQGPDVSSLSCQVDGASGNEAGDGPWIAGSRSCPIFVMGGETSGLSSPNVAVTYYCQVLSPSDMPTPAGASAPPPWQEAPCSVVVTFSEPSATPAPGR